MGELVDSLVGGLTCRQSDGGVGEHTVSLVDGGWDDLQSTWWVGGELVGLLVGRLTLGCYECVNLLTFWLVG